MSLPRPTVYAIDGVVPVIDPTAFVHPSAVLIGDVVVGPGCYVGPCASLRGDFGRIVLEAGSNVQDNCTLHAFPGHDAVVEADGHVGHGAVLHGCVVKQGALVGMNVVVMDGAVIGEEAVVAAMAFVKAGFVVPPRTLVAGLPAKLVRELRPDEIAWKAEGTLEYQRLARRSRATMIACAPLEAVEPDRARVDAGTSQPLHRVKGA
ncbi:transferase hexapeptide repeat family protein [Azospirillum doebereinerae]|uniref:Transferase hexapeptide repeat family protein n=1 Tax=Azospirillum doebereinerae TaxID=92933 RepID=A0A3S0XD00_9PROT|nr:transferase hexapeptide repeat family protein [Azospirillum doebereinerae]MCG5242042.1 transferase hexapeptide repeat family protein [Azospirillum doebereinerae]RUQ74250.1 transferase hexapeptide repeat family protein [Azospirillum doebereinerae]